MSGHKKRMIRTGIASEQRADADSYHSGDSPSDAFLTRRQAPDGLRDASECEDDERLRRNVCTDDVALDELSRHVSRARNDDILLRNGMSAVRGTMTFFFAMVFSARGLLEWRMVILPFFRLFSPLKVTSMGCSLLLVLTTFRIYWSLFLS